MMANLRDTVGYKLVILSKTKKNYVTFYTSQNIDLVRTNLETFTFPFAKYGNEMVSIYLD